MVRGSGARAFDQGIAPTELHHPQSHPRSNECCLASNAGWEGPTPTRDTTTLTDSVYSPELNQKTRTPESLFCCRALIPADICSEETERRAGTK